MNSMTRRGVMLAALLIAAGAAPLARGGDPPPDAWKPTPPEKVTDGSSPQVSPGGERLAFYRHQVDVKTRDPEGQPRTIALLHLKDLATGTESVAARNGRVAAWSGDDLLVLEDGTSLRIAGEGGEPSFPKLPEGYAPTSGRSRDGKALAWVGSAEFAKLPVVGESMPPVAVHVLVEGKPVRAFAVGDGPYMRGSRGFLAFSPDGTRLAMHLDFMHYGQPPHPRVALLDLTSGEATFVLDEPYGSHGAGDAGTWQSGAAAEGVWDGQGSRFVFVRTIGDSKRDLFTAAGDGSDLRRVTADGRWKASPCLSPEGDRCACWAEAAAPPGSAKGGGRSRAPSERAAEPSRLLSLYQLRTGERVDLPVPVSGAGSDLHWSRDGKALWFEWTAAGETGIWRVEAPPPALVPAGTPLIDRTVSPLDDLLESLASEDDNEVEQAIEESGKFADARVTDALRDVMRRWARNDHRPYPCVQALRERGALSAIPELMEELARGEWLDAVSPPLIEWRVAAAIPLWRRVLATGPPGGRATAAVALASMGEKDGWDAVREVARKSDADVLWKLCTALSLARDARSVDLLIPLLSNTEEIYAGHTVQQSAAGALKVLTGESLGHDPDEWTKWWTSVGKKLPGASTDGTDDR